VQKSSALTLQCHICLSHHCNCTFTITPFAYPPVIFNVLHFHSLCVLLTAGSGRSTLMLPLGGGRRLPLDVLHLLGEGRHLQLATVSKEWRSLYMQLYPGCETHVTTIVVTAPLLAWARSSGYEWTEETSHSIAKGGHLETLQWARANGCPWDSGTCDAAAQGGNLETLQWARANGCPWDDWTFAIAAKGGHLELLECALANGCPWSAYACSTPAGSGHLHVLQWLHANGCPWDARTSTAAAQGGHDHVLQWAVDNGCPDPEIYSKSPEY
jgi:hypothetical protein